MSYSAEGESLSSRLERIALTDCSSDRTSILINDSRSASTLAREYKSFDATSAQSPLPLRRTLETELSSTTISTTTRLYERTVSRSQELESLALIVLEPLRRRMRILELD